jgi:hypothetical protein
MPFFSWSHYLRLTGIQRKSMCFLNGVGVKNVELLLFQGVPSHTWRTGRLERRKWKEVLYGIAKRYWRYKAKHKGLIDVKFVTLDTCFRLEITSVCTLHSNLSCCCQIYFHFTHFRIEQTCTVYRPRRYHWSTKFNFFLVPRGKISNPDSTFNAEFKYVISFSPSPTVFL